MSGFITELKRRKVFRVAAGYAIVGWLLIQVSDIVFPRLGLPNWTVTFIILVVFIGFPIALFLAWAYELTPEGVKPTADASDGDRRRTGSTAWVDLSLLGLLVVLVGVAGWNRLATDHAAPQVSVSDDGQDHRAPAAVDPSEADAIPAGSVAVLPFDDLSPGDDRQWFADGLTEEILHSLARLPELKVMARHSSFQYRDRDRDLGEVSEDLGVAHLVIGSVRVAGERLRVSVQLMRTRDGLLLWSEVYDGSLVDVIDVQQDIAENIGRVLAVYLDEERLDHMFATGTRNPDAFLAYLRGRALFDQAHLTGDDDLNVLWEANDWFERAFTVDPQYAPAFFYHLDAFSHVLQQDLDPPPFLQDDGGALDQDLALKHMQGDLEQAQRAAGGTAFGKVTALVRHFVLGEWERLPSLIEDLDERTVVEAMELLTGGFYYYAPLILGRDEEAARVWNWVLERDPYSPFAWRAAAGVALHSGQPEQALEIAGRARDLGVRHAGLFETRIQALLRLGRYDEAREWLVLEAQQFPPATLWWPEGLIHAELGNFDEISRLLADLDPLQPRSDRRCWLLARIGQQSQANECAAAIDAQPLGWVRLAKTVVDGGSLPFDLHATPRFASILARSVAPPWTRTEPVQARPRQDHDVL